MHDRLYLYSLLIGDVLLVLLQIWLVCGWLSLEAWSSDEGAKIMVDSDSRSPLEVN